MVLLVSHLNLHSAVICKIEPFFVEHFQVLTADDKPACMKQVRKKMAVVGVFPSV